MIWLVLVLFHLSQQRAQGNVTCDLLILLLMHDNYITGFIIARKSIKNTCYKLVIFHVICKSHVIFYSCKMGTSNLPEMYTQSPRFTGPRTEGVHIRKTTSAHVTTVMCHEHSY